MNKTTLTEIAEAAGVSISTVDRVINRRGGVSASAEAKVLEWARRLNLDRRIFRSHLRNLRIAVLMQSPHNPFYRALRDAFSEANLNATEVGITCFIHYIDVMDFAGTRAKIGELAASYDGIIITAPNEPRLAEALRRVSDKVAVMTLATDIPASGRIAYVGPDNRQAGRVAGELMGRFIGSNGGNILIVLGMHNMTGHEEREMGFRSVLRERFPISCIVASLESEEDPLRAGDVVSKALKNYPKVRGIYNASAGNTNIARSIDRLGLGQHVVMITHELTPSRRKLLRDGILDAVIDQNPKLEVQHALQVMARHFQQSDVSAAATNHTPISIFIRESCPTAEDL